MGDYRGSCGVCEGPLCSAQSDGGGTGAIRLALAVGVDGTLSVAIQLPAAGTGNAQGLRKALGRETGRAPAATCHAAVPATIPCSENTYERSLCYA